MAQENAAAFARAWENAVKLLTDAVDDITTIDDFLAVSGEYNLQTVLLGPDSAITMVPQ